MILQAPGAIVPQQHHDLVTPLYPHFEELEIDGPALFEIDPRLGG